MFLIQPCCAQKDLLTVRTAIKRGGTTQFEGYGDLSLAELLKPMLTRYGEVDMMIVAPSLPDQAAEAIDREMNRQWSRQDGLGKVNEIGHLTIVARLDKEKSDYIYRWLKDKPYGDRLTLIDMEQEDTAILLPDFAIAGPVNMQYNRHFVATATTEQDKVNALWEKYGEMTENAPVAKPAPKKKSPRKKQKK
jgi:hypothetical protein